MARLNQIVPEPKPGEHIQVLSDGPTPQYDIRDIAADDRSIKGSAVDPDQVAKDTAASTVRRYRVLNGGQCATQRNGQRTHVNQGKILDELNFDIALMREQGIMFEEVTQTA